MNMRSDENGSDEIDLDLIPGAAPILPSDKWTPYPKMERDRGDKEPKDKKQEEINKISQKIRNLERLDNAGEVLFGGIGVIGLATDSFGLQLTGIAGLAAFKTANLGAKHDYEDSKEKLQKNDPLILDLDRDGVANFSVDESQVTFDWDGDGYREYTAWASAEDGMLVIDEGANGKIESGK